MKEMVEVRCNNAKCPKPDRMFKKGKYEASKHEKHFCSVACRVAFQKSPYGKRWISKKKQAQVDLHKKLAEKGGKKLVNVR